MTSTPTNNACGDLDDYTRRDRQETITEPWTWKTDDKCGVIVKNQDGVNQLDEYARVCPGRVEVGNKNGRGEFKTFNLGNTRLTAFDNQLEFFDVNNPNGVTLSELVACCDTDDGGGSGGGGFDPIAMNFPGNDSYPAVHTRQHTGTAINSSEDITLLNIFNGDDRYQVIEMPPGANAAAVFFTYSAQIGPWELKTRDGTGYCNIGYTMDLSDNKGSLTSSPGKLAAGIKLYGEIKKWDDVKGIAAGESDQVRIQRTPTIHTATANKIVRIRFNESTSESPTRVTFRPQCDIHRIRGCEAIIGSGRCLVIPYHDDGTNWKPRDIGPDESDYIDDGQPTPEFDQKFESRELKDRMNFMSNAIRETLDYDEGLDPTRKPLLEQALKDIFALKREDVDDVTYYASRLDAITEAVIPDVGFTFGFETINPVKSF